MREPTDVLFGKFWALIPWVLEIAIILDLVLERWIEAAVIAALLAFNALTDGFGVPMLALLGRNDQSSGAPRH